MGGAICLASWTVIQENGWRTHSAPSVVQMKTITTLEMAVPGKVSRWRHSSSTWSDNKE